MTEEELVANAFTDPKIDGEQLYDPLLTFKDIYKMNSSILMSNNLFFDAYNNLKIIDTEEVTINNGETHLLKLVFELDGKKYETFTYLPNPINKTSMAGLFIPGSGQNSTSNPEAFKGIMKAIGDDIDTYLFVRPNEDWIAFHNGENKLNINYYVNWFIGMGASFSAYYITASMAFSKYLKTVYDKVLIAGCSQGGAASLLNSLQSNPDIAVIASGFSILFDEILPSGHNQIIIPGLRKIYNSESIRKKIHESSTSYLFTWGKNDNDYYAYEAEKKLSLDYMSGPNFIGKIHDGGHEFPEKEIREFMNEFL